MRAPAPRRSRHSSMTTPRSLSISASSNETLCAQSSRISSALSSTSGLSVGTCEHVDGLVEAGVGVDVGPKRMPIDSRNLTDLLLRESASCR